MKKMLRLLLLSAALAVMLSVGAFAADLDKGVYDAAASDAEKFTISANATAAGTKSIEIDSASKTVSLNATSVTVTYKNAVASKQYLLIVTDEELTGTKVPTGGSNGNIQYINQDAPASDGNVTFSTVYPKTLSNGKTYYVYLISDDGTLTSLTPAGTFKYYAAYILGDASGDNYIKVGDATLVLRYCAELIDKTGLNVDAADTSGDGFVKVGDATLILRYCAELISEF